MSIVRDGEAFLFGAHISPLTAASTHVIADPVRTRKLLHEPKELQHLIGSVERRVIRWYRSSCTGRKDAPNSSVGVAKGKKQHDKRATEKDRDWQRDKARLMRRG